MALRASVYFHGSSSVALLYGFSAQLLMEWATKPENLRKYGNLWNQISSNAVSGDYHGEVMCFSGGAKLYRIEWEPNDDDRERKEVERWKIMGYTRGGDVLSALQELFGYH